MLTDVLSISYLFTAVVRLLSAAAIDPFHKTASFQVPQMSGLVRGIFWAIVQPSSHSLNQARKLSGVRFLVHDILAFRDSIVLEIFGSLRICFASLRPGQQPGVQLALESKAAIRKG